MTDPWTMRRVPTAERAADRAEHVFPLVTDWLFSEPMAAVLEAFGGWLPGPGFAGDRDGGDVNGWLHPNEKLPDWLYRVVTDPAAGVSGLSPAQVDILSRTLAIERMAADGFNFREGAGQQYRERMQASAADFTPEFRARVLELTRQLGLVCAQEPRASRYDKTLVLGGGYRSPLLRARYAALLRSKGFQLGEVSFLGSPRFLIEDPPERPLTEAYAPGASDEFDLMVAAAQAEFGLTPARITFLCGCTSADARCPNWPARDAERAGETPPAYTHERRADLVDDTGRTVAWVLSASTGRPPLRPDTSDTFSLWARCANPQAGQRVLVVTSQVFVPFQSFDGVRQLYLPHGVDLDVVGYGDDWEDRPRPAEYLLQETLSAIRSGRRLLVDAAGTLMGASLMGPDELRRLCAGFRNAEKLHTDDALTDRIESDVREYETFMADPRPQLPPPPLAELLPLMGWLIYEASWDAVQRVDTAFELLPAADRSDSEVAYRQVRRLAHAAGQLPWPEFAPRSLGAVRAQALAESKRDTQGGYDAAWTAHGEARKLHKSYLDSHGHGPSRERFLRDLDEVLLQLDLAETGTACRTAERVISRWSEELAVADPQENKANEALWIQRMHRELLGGVQIGEQAIATVSRIKQQHGLVENVDEDRLAMWTGFQNPGIMTARAALLALALCPAMEDLGRSDPDGRSWPRARANLLKRFTAAYRFIEEPVVRADGTSVPMRFEHQRSLVQIRLNLALVVPGYALPARHPFDPCLALNPLDDRAVQALSGWLAATKANGQRRGDANAIGSATMPSFIRSVLRCRSLRGVDSGYHEWRAAWFELDRHASEDGRKARVTAVLDATRPADKGAS